MRTSIYIFCCIFCLFMTIDTSYSVIQKVTEEPFTFRLFMRILAVLGWILITYGVVMRKYQWVQKLCKTDNDAN